MNILDFILQHNLPHQSMVIDMQHVMDNHRGLEPSEYRVRIIELTHRGDELLDREAEYIYLYLIQETLTTYFNNKDQQINMGIMYNIAERKAIDYIEANPHLFVESEATTIDSSGKAKPKRGSKKDKTCKLWAERQDDNLSRQEWIKLLMEEVELTKGGASTYYAKLKKGTFGC